MTITPVKLRLAWMGFAFPVLLVALLETGSRTGYLQLFFAGSSWLLFTRYFNLRKLVVAGFGFLGVLFCPEYGLTICSTQDFSRSR